MSEVLKVQSREALRSRHVRRLREQGFVPAVLYGHGEGALSLQVAVGDLLLVMRAGHRFVDLQGSVTDKAMIKAVQWDALGSEVLHVDLARVSATESIVMEVPLELRGDAPGLGQGGVVEQSVYKLTVKGPVDALPERIELKLHDLQFGGHITAAAIVLPAKCELSIPLETILVSCHAPKATKEGDGVGVPVEPEVIRREKAAAEEAAEKKK